VNPRVIFPYRLRAYKGGLYQTELAVLAKVATPVWVKVTVNRV